MPNCKSICYVVFAGFLDIALISGASKGKRSLNYNFYFSVKN